MEDISRSYDLRTIHKHCAPIKSFRTTEELLELFARNEKGSKENGLLINETLITESLPSRESVAGTHEEQEDALPSSHES